MNDQNDRFWQLVAISPEIFIKKLIFMEKLGIKEKGKNSIPDRNPAI